MTRVQMAGGLALSVCLALSVGLLAASCSSAGAGSAEPTDVDPASETSVAFGGTDDDAAEAPGTTTERADDADESTSAPVDGSPSAEEVAAVEAEVERVIRRNWEIWVECTTDIEECDPAAALAETESTTSQFYLNSVAAVEQWRQEGIAYRAVEGRPVDSFVEIRSIEVAPDLESAEVLLCDRDDRGEFQRGADGRYELVQGSDFALDLLLRRVVAVENGEWKIVDNELLDQRPASGGIDPLC